MKIVCIIEWLNAQLTRSLCTLLPVVKSVHILEAVGVAASLCESAVAYSYGHAQVSLFQNFLTFGVVNLIVCRYSVKAL